MPNRLTFATASVVMTLIYGSWTPLPAHAQSWATSEASSEADSEASSQASSEASVESGLVFGPTGYEVFQPWPRRYMQPLGSHGYPYQGGDLEQIQPWPPAYMQPLGPNGYPLAAQVDTSFVYWDGTQPGFAAPPVQWYAPTLAPTPVPLPAPTPLPEVTPPARQYGLARVFPHHRVLHRRRH